MKRQKGLLFIRSELKRFSDPKRALGEKKYLKSRLRHYGVTVPKIHQIIRVFKTGSYIVEVKSLLSLVDELWNSGWYEELSVAVELLVEYVDMLTSREFPYFIKLADEAETWALVDPMSIQVMGKLVMKDPGLENSWQQMAKHENFWVRRAAILTHIAFFRSGRCNLGHFEAMVVPMFEEDSSWTKQERFFIRKAIGWSLREVAVREPEQVVNFVMHHGREMSGLTHREATRRLPESMKQLF